MEIAMLKYSFTVGYDEIYPMSKHIYGEGANFFISMTMKMFSKKGTKMLSFVVGYDIIPFRIYL
jgi:hypothetical protein